MKQITDYEVHQQLTFLYLDELMAISIPKKDLDKSQVDAVTTLVSIKLEEESKG